MNHRPVFCSSSLQAVFALAYSSLSEALTVFSPSKCCVLIWSETDCISLFIVMIHFEQTLSFLGVHKGYSPHLILRAHTSPGRQAGRSARGQPVSVATEVHNAFLGLGHCGQMVNHRVCLEPDNIEVFLFLEL